MAVLISDLKLKENPATIVHPNIERANIPNNAINTSKIDALAVTTGKIAPNAVTSARIADGAVTESKILDNSVGATKLQSSSITTDKIVNGAVTTGKIATRSVTENRLNIKQINFVDWCALQGLVNNHTWQELGAAFSALISQDYGLTISMHYEQGTQRSQVFLGVDAAGAGFMFMSDDFTQQIDFDTDAKVATFMDVNGVARDIYITFID